ncbi:MAG: DNA-processing protein DprA [Acidimicrobiia bacterium]
MNDARLRIAFAGLHPDKTRELLARFGPRGALRRIMASASSPRAAQAAAVDATTRHRELRALGLQFLLKGCSTYPSHLAELPDAPDALFVRGTLGSDRGVAVVGTRRCTTYGRRLARAYGAAIAGAGWPLVSGLARGIDGAAHTGTVGAGGYGVAVLGCGLDVSYPREHGPLARELLEHGGAIVSEYPPGTPPEGWRFPPRNRILSGLAAAVVVVEANVRGGALITANAALEHGTRVFAVPGDVGRESSEGCNRLIRDGAQPVLDPADLVAELELVLGPVNRSRDHVVDAGLPVEVPGEGISVDDLVVRLAMDPGRALAQLATWETGGLVERIGEVVYPVAER